MCCLIRTTAVCSSHRHALSELDPPECVFQEVPGGCSNLSSDRFNDLFWQPPDVLDCPGPPRKVHLDTPIGGCQNESLNFEHFEAVLGTSSRINQCFKEE